MKKVVAIILAAGRGSRAGAGLPKTYREIDGTPVLRKTIDVFLSCSSISNVQVVIHPDDIEHYQRAINGLNLPKPIFGGDSRAQSVSNAISAIDAEFVLIHDGARPFVSQDVIMRVVNKLHEGLDGVIPAIMAVDAMWQVNGEYLVVPIDRSTVVRAQTPQGFHFAKYKAALEMANAKDTILDDAQAAIQMGLTVAWVDGDAQNVKLTFPEDFEAET